MITGRMLICLGRKTIFSGATVFCGYADPNIVQWSLNWSSKNNQMTAAEVCHMRLANQQISVHHTGKPEDVVAWMGAMQAQDYGMSLWGVGTRLPGATRAAIQSAIDRGKIIRTHVLRPTWHLASVKDIGWMLDLTAPHIKARASSRFRELELSQPVLTRSLKILEKTLADAKHCTRDELLDALNKKRIDTTDQRASHILLWAELSKVICSGPLIGKKNTYALFDDRVGTYRKLTRADGLRNLALRYFTSRGPATSLDFMTWSGLPKKEVDQATELVRDDLIQERMGSTAYWLKDTGAYAPNSAERMYLLPAFDEYTIGYKDRSAVLAAKHKSAVMSSNGILWPVIVINGQVMGLWKRTVSKKGQVLVELNYFPRTPIKNDPKIKRLAAEAVEKVRSFFGTEDKEPVG